MNLWVLAALLATVPPEPPIGVFSLGCDTPPKASVTVAIVKTVVKP